MPLLFSFDGPRFRASYPPGDSLDQWKHRLEVDPIFFFRSIGQSTFQVSFSKIIFRCFPQRSWVVCRFVSKHLLVVFGKLVGCPLGQLGFLVLLIRKLLISPNWFSPAWRTYSMFQGSWTTNPRFETPTSWGFIFGPPRRSSSAFCRSTFGHMRARRGAPKPYIQGD